MPGVCICVVKCVWYVAIKRAQHPCCSLSCHEQHQARRRHTPTPYCISTQPLNERPHKSLKPVIMLFVRSSFMAFYFALMHISFCPALLVCDVPRTRSLAYLHSWILTYRHTQSSARLQRGRNKWTPQKASYFIHRPALELKKTHSHTQQMKEPLPLLLLLAPGDSSLVTIYATRLSGVTSRLHNAVSVQGFCALGLRKCAINA